MSDAAAQPSPALAASPCINVCRMADGSGLCEGCFRTLDEIAGWAGASNDARHAVLAEVERRRAAQVAADGPGAPR